MQLPAISEFVPAPRILAPSDRLTDLAAELRRHGYDLARCARRLGVFPRLGVNFWPALRRGWTPSPDDPIDTLLELFVEGHPMPLDRLGAHVSPAFIETVLDARLAVLKNGLLESQVCLFPCYGRYIVTDRAVKNTALNQVMWLWGESFILGGLVKRSVRRRAIDLGTGSGVHAILASAHCQSVVAVDVNPRALEFARFNAVLNGADNVEFVLSDLFTSVPGEFDLSVANPPYAPDGSARAGDNFWSGGCDGTELLQRIVAALPERLDAGGVACINALHPNPPGTRIRDHFDRWLGGTIDRYEVLDYTWPVPNYEDVLSEQPFQGDKSAWRFGVVSLRRARGSAGWWKELAGRGMFFRADGSCSVVADHDAP